MNKNTSSQLSIVHGTAAVPSSPPPSSGSVFASLARRLTKPSTSGSIDASANMKIAATSSTQTQSQAKTHALEATTATATATNKQKSPKVEYISKESMAHIRIR